MSSTCALAGRAPLGEWAPDLHFHRSTLTFDSGKTERLKPLGKGMFTRAYVTEGKRKPEVYLFTGDSGDYSKDILIEARRQTRSAYLPKVEKVGDTNDATVYKEPLYRSPLRKYDGEKAYAEYKALKRCWKWAESEVRSKHGWRMVQHMGFEVMDTVVSCMKGSKLGKGKAAKPVSKALVRALDSVRDNAVNYGAEWTFEFSPKNLATTESGQLILLDPIFSMEAARRVRESRRRGVSLRHSWGLRGWPRHVQGLAKARRGRFFG